MCSVQPSVSRSSIPNLNSAKELARKAGLDKSYASRTVSSLIERGYVRSAKNEADARGVALTLTPEGQTLYERAFNQAVARNRRLMNPLTELQQRQLMEILGAVMISARRELDDERRAAKGEPADYGAESADMGNTTSTPSKEDSSSLDMVELRYLSQRLAELLSSHPAA